MQIVTDCSSIARFLGFDGEYPSIVDADEKIHYEAIPIFVKELQPTRWTIAEGNKSRRDGGFDIDFHKELLTPEELDGLSL